MFFNMGVGGSYENVRREAQTGGVWREYAPSETLQNVSENDASSCNINTF